MSIEGAWTNYTFEVLKYLGVKWLSNDVSQLILDLNIVQGHNFFFHKLLNKVVSYIDMFCS